MPPVWNRLVAALSPSMGDRLFYLFLNLITSPYGFSFLLPGLSLHASTPAATSRPRASGKTTVGKCSSVGTHDECAMTDSRAPQPASAVTWPPTMGKRCGTATLVRPASAAVEPPTSGIVLQQARMTVWPPMVSAAKSGGGVVTSCSGVHIQVE